MNNKELTIIDTKQEIKKFLNGPTKVVCEFIMGIMKSNKIDWIDSTGRIFNAGLKNRLLQQLHKELETYQKKGKIKEDFLETNHNMMSMKEILNIIDSDPPDETKFKAIKSIFFAGIAVNATEKDEVLSCHYLKIIKQMSSGSIQSLKALYEITHGQVVRANENLNLIDTNVQNWLGAVARQAGFDHHALAELYEEELVKLKLINQRYYFNDGSNRITPNQNYRLTSLGISLCEFIKRYE